MDKAMLLQFSSLSKGTPSTFNMPGIKVVLVYQLHICESMAKRLKGIKWQVEM